MPVRSLQSPVFKWPDRETVHRALAAWAQEAGRQHPDVACIGYVGTYARGDRGVGSDLDVVIVLDHTETPFMERGLRFDATRLPVPVDLFVYTRAEWADETHAFVTSLRREAVWVYENPEGIKAV